LQEKRNTRRVAEIEEKDSRPRRRGIRVKHEKRNQVVGLEERVNKRGGIQVA
jgi:hypothetical protein